MPLVAAVDRLADRLRALPQSKLQLRAAVEGLALARELAVRAQRLEDREPELVPDAGMFVVADQVAVAGHDVAEALRNVTDGAAEQLADALALVEAAAQRCGLATTTR